MLYRRKAMLHHYTEFVDAGTVGAAEEIVSQVAKDYKSIEDDSFVGTPAAAQQLDLFPAF